MENWSELQYKYLFYYCASKIIISIIITNIINNNNTIYIIYSIMTYILHTGHLYLTIGSENEINSVKKT